MSTIFKMTFNKPTTVHFFKPDGTKVTYTLPRNPNVDDIIADVHNRDENAVIMMCRESDGRIHLVPGKTQMTNEARNALMGDVDAWLAGLDAARYSGKKDTVSFGSGCANGGCIIQPPKKSALNDTLKANTRAAILNWTKHATAPGAAPAGKTPAPAGGTPAPASGTPAPASGTPAPASKTPAPASKTPAPASGTPAPASKTPAPAPAPLNPDYAAGVNAFRKAYEALLGDKSPVSWEKGKRV